MGPKSDGTAEILLFNGTGFSPNDVRAFETILKDQHVNYSKVNSSQLNWMSEAQMRQHRLRIVPGGNFINIGIHPERNRKHPRRGAERFKLPWSLRWGILCRKFPN
jgi:hypothetical protein